MNYIFNCNYLHVSKSIICLCCCCCFCCLKPEFVDAKIHFCGLQLLMLRLKPKLLFIMQILNMITWHLWCPNFCTYHSYIFGKKLNITKQYVATFMGGPVKFHTMIQLISFAWFLFLDKPVLLLMVPLHERDYNRRQMCQ